MDLISRKAVRKGMIRYGFKAPDMTVNEFVDDELPSVPAVPLEPLCKWLAGYAAPPNYALDEVRDDSIDPESLVYTANDRAKAWEYHFRELLKSGLMDTEE